MKKVLILEDEEVLGKIYKKRLEESGYEVLLTTTADEAEESSKSYKADATLLDHGIHGHEKSGTDLIPFIKKYLPDTKIIMISNYSDFDLERRAIEAGADAYLVKLNHSPKALVNYLDNLLEKQA